MRKGDQSAAWWDVLRAAVNAQRPQDGVLLPHVNVAEAIGDLPPIVAPNSHSSRGGSSTLRSKGGSWHLDNPAALNWWQQLSIGSSRGSSSDGYGSRRSLPQQQQQQQQQPGSLRQDLDDLREAGIDAARALGSIRKGQGDPFGLPVTSYDPQQGVLLYQLPAPVADLRPVSVYAQHMRSSHRAGVGFLRGFNPALLYDHTYPGMPTLSLPRTGKNVMTGLGVVGTVVGKNTPGSRTVHFAEPRQATMLERVSWGGGEGTWGEVTCLKEGTGCGRYCGGQEHHQTVDGPLWGAEAGHHAGAGEQVDAAARRAGGGGVLGVGGCGFHFTPFHT
jgi:hypothetical protein